MKSTLSRIFHLHRPGTSAAQTTASAAGAGSSSGGRTSRSTSSDGSGPSSALRARHSNAASAGAASPRQASPSSVRAHRDGDILAAIAHMNGGNPSSPTPATPSRSEQAHRQADIQSAIEHMQGGAPKPRQRTTLQDAFRQQDAADAAAGSQRSDSFSFRNPASGGADEASAGTSSFDAHPFANRSSDTAGTRRPTDPEDRVPDFDNESLDDDEIEALIASLRPEGTAASTPSEETDAAISSRRSDTFSYRRSDSGSSGSSGKASAGSSSFEYAPHADRLSNAERDTIKKLTKSTAEKQQAAGAAGPSQSEPAHDISSERSASIAEYHRSALPPHRESPPKKLPSIPE
ncbi:hypothetical protein [Paracidovorax konjaci]|uniref:Uncharacterized protein n=1 Tax=Paracidovorax konjaci TaxID=32040 RepID=A0A1I1Y1S0_9BURK|nr:hypothetical protein [Paracidovorax konjaci]SFE13645.1 hypothetical protein SAMN04489710_11584 [Paracidovorax konjaci]